MDLVWDVLVWRQSSRCAVQQVLASTDRPGALDQSVSVDQQRIQVRTIQGRFAHYLGATSDCCEVLVQRMLKRTGSVALLRELCESWFSGNFTTCWCQSYYTSRMAGPGPDHGATRSEFINGKWLPRVFLIELIQKYLTISSTKRTVNHQPPLRP